MAGERYLFCMRAHVAGRPAAPYALPPIRRKLERLGRGAVGGRRGSAGREGRALLLPPVLIDLIKEHSRWLQSQMVGERVWGETS